MDYHVRVVDVVWGGAVWRNDFDVQCGVRKMEFQEGVKDYVKSFAVPFGASAQNVEGSCLKARGGVPHGSIHPQRYDVHVVVVLGKQVKVVEAWDDNGFELGQVFKEFGWEFVGFPHREDCGSLPVIPAFNHVWLHRIHDMLGTVIKSDFGGEGVSERDEHASVADLG